MSKHMKFKGKDLPVFTTNFLCLLRRKISEKYQNLMAIWNYKSEALNIWRACVHIYAKYEFSMSNPVASSTVHRRQWQGTHHGQNMIVQALWMINQISQKVYFMENRTHLFHQLKMLFLTKWHVMEELTITSTITLSSFRFTILFMHKLSLVQFT